MANKYFINLPEKTTPEDSNILPIEDSQDTKRMTWANLKTAIIGAFSSILGNRTYTEQNVVTNGESITKSIDELDIDLASHKADYANRIISQNSVVFRDGTLSGSQTVTFTNLGLPKKINITSYSHGLPNLCMGTYDNGNVESIVTHDGGDIWYDAARRIVWIGSNSAGIYATLSNITNTSFVLNWTLLGSGFGTTIRCHIEIMY